MSIPAGIEIFQPCKPDITWPDVRSCLITARVVPPVCIFPAHLGTGVDESRLLFVKVGQGEKLNKVEHTHKRRKPSIVNGDCYRAHGRAERWDV